MKTTVNIPDAFYRKLVAVSAAEGLSIEDYVVRTMSEKLSSGSDSPTEMSTKKEPLAKFWAHIDSLSEQERRSLQEGAAEIQAYVDDEFSRVDPDDWK